jgi:small subunit ribosomal protein S18
MEQVKRKRFQKRKSCKFCEDKVAVIDYKDVKLLKMYVSERGKIIPRRITGSCAKHQRSLTTSIKRARGIALIPFAAG